MLTWFLKPYKRVLLLPIYHIIIWNIVKFLLMMINAIVLPFYLLFALVLKILVITDLLLYIFLIRLGYLQLYFLQLYSPSIHRAHTYCIYRIRLIIPFFFFKSLLFNGSVCFYSKTSLTGIFSN